jgi:hypothetical protein
MIFNVPVPVFFNVADVKPCSFMSAFRFKAEHNRSTVPLRVPFSTGAAHAVELLGRWCG